MSLQEQLRQDLKDAMRAKDAPRKSALRMVLSAIQLAQVSSPEPLEDDAVVALIRTREQSDRLSARVGRGEDRHR